MPAINRSTYDFLRELAANNNREWFAEHKDRYKAARGNVAAFADELLERLRKTDVISTENGRKSLFRIYRDVRFSKNKLPYKTNIAGSFTRDGFLRRGGYYFTLSPERNAVGGGFYGIERDDLKRIREELAASAGEMRSILAGDKFTEQFSGLLGEQLKTAPQGYPRDHPNIDLLRYRQFYATREFTETEVLDPGFIDRAEDVLLALRPFFDYFSDILTTDANGQPLY
ncbi:DUF2461 domain-containing protein [Lewinella sp. IMCC34191]|uniref:DUF2461 domain-containing protein n=1 Tax=Lewinella sp. IMCC34191 TaxID=2259172 RepID=UPI000E2258CE|nr:DUF2461 domain-containing protein [Lewinella sp. IMCC34191]